MARSWVSLFQDNGLVGNMALACALTSSFSTKNGEQRDRSFDLAKLKL